MNKGNFSFELELKRIFFSQQINGTTKKFIINNAPIIEDLEVNCDVKNPQNEIVGINFLKIHVGESWTLDRQKSKNTFIDIND